MPTSQIGRDRNNGPFVVGFVFGILAGGVLAGLWTPRSGPQLRQLARKQGRAIKEHTEDIILRAQTTAHAAMTRD